MPNLATWMRQKDEKWFQPFLAKHPDIRVFDARKADVSLDALAGPPSSLHTERTADVSPSKSQTASSPSSDTHLTEEEAIALADSEARTQGYNLDDYHRPKGDYSAVKNKWSLIYDLKDAGAADENTKQFIATVEEKTKNVEIRK